MPLTTTQLQALKADIAADPVLSLVPNTADGNQQVADAYNAPASPDFFAWQTAVPAGDIYDQVTWANYTPQDAADSTVLYQNRAMLCQTKQMNLQLMLQGRDSFNAARSTLRGGLNDATTNLPSGASGANRSGGWANILPVLRRKARRVEKLFAVSTTGVGNNGADPLGAMTNPALMVVEGTISAADVLNARNS